MLVTVLEIFKYNNIEGKKKGVTGGLE